MKKNVASQVIGVQMTSATDGSAFTGTVTVYVTGDAGTQAIGSVGSGVCTHEGNGFHTYAPAQAETNYDHIGFTFIGTGAIPSTLQVYTTFPQTGDNFALIGTAGAGLTNINLPDQTMNIIGNITGNLSGSVGSVTGAVGSVTAGVTVTTNNDKTGYTVSTVSDKTGYSLSATGADLIPYNSTFLVASAKATWTDTLTTYTDGMAGKRIKGITAVPTIEGTINDVSATTTSFATTLTGYGDTFFNDTLLNVEIATDQWQGMPVASYTSATGTFTFDEPFISAPANGSNIAVHSTHIHTVSEIQAGLATSSQISALNNIAATDIVTGGPITTSAGAVANVDLVDICTTNSDMRGTDGANTTAPDNASIALILEDTADMQPRILTMETDINNLDLGIIYGTAATGTLTTTAATTNLSGYADNQLVGAVIVVTSGAAEGERRDITAYTEIGGIIEFVAMTIPMANGDTFKIV